MPAPLPHNEAERLRALLRYRILDTLPEVAFDDITHLAAQICQTPVALISLLDSHRQWYKSHYGTSITESPRETSLCTHALMTPRETMIVPDTTQDPRFSDRDYVTGPFPVRFYAGAPLVTSTGYAIGTLCVIDREPRKLTLGQVDALERLSRHTMRLFDARIEQEKLRAANERLTTQSQTDGLTGLHNRRWFQKRLAYLWNEAQRKNEPLSIILMDLDGFKLYNDTHGHLAGDVLLKLAARVLKKCCRPQSRDGAARFGGDEMALLLPRTTTEEALAIAHCLQFPVLTPALAGALRHIHAETTPMSFSVGVATLDPRVVHAGNCTFDDLIHAADEALYEAKRSGKNRVVVAPFLQASCPP